MTEKDKQRLRRALEYALSNNEEYVIARYARMSNDWRIKTKTYMLHFKIEEDERRVDD